MTIEDNFVWALRGRRILWLGLAVINNTAYNVVGLYSLCCV